jgi:hypothetical protein
VLSYKLANSDDSLGDGVKVSRWFHWWVLFKLHFQDFFFTGNKQVRVQVMSVEAQSKDASLGAVS